MGERSTQYHRSRWLMTRRVALAGLTFVDWYEFFGAASMLDADRTDVAIFVAGIVAAALAGVRRRRVVAPALAAGSARSPSSCGCEPPGDPLKFGISPWRRLAAVGGVIGRCRAARPASSRYR